MSKIEENIILPKDVVVLEKNIYATPYSNRTYATEEDARYFECKHIECNECGKIAKRNGYRLCCECASKKETERFNKLELVEWAGEPLFLYDSDMLFFDENDISDYCEENDVDVSELKLVIAEPTRFRQIDVYDFQDDVVHENWEPDGELCALVDDLNEYLRTAKTDTYIPGKKRVSIGKI